MTHSIDGAFFREFALNKERITIGRKAQNDLQIESQSASGEHARIVTLGPDSFLEDVGSTNGTRVNGTPVTKHLLRNGDMIEIGNHSLRFVSEAVRAESEDFEKTIVLQAPVKAPIRAQREPVKEEPGFFAKLLSWFKK